MVTSKGAAGVTGSGFVVLASTLTAIKVIPVEGLALLLGVDRFMSEARAITNFIGNGVATVFLANNEKEFNREQMKAAFANEVYEYGVDATDSSGKEIKTTLTDKQTSKLL
jgi:aerobic C4-dicarboxylate transport protein